MHSIESKIHQTMLDLDPSLSHEYEQAAIIVAEASANYKIALKNIDNVRYASAKEKSEAEESMVLDSILQAMDVLAETSDFNCRYSFSPLIDMLEDDDNIEYDAILRNIRYSADIDDSDMNLLEAKDDDDNLFEIEDIFSDEHAADLYHSLGVKKHRADSNARGI